MKPMSSTLIRNPHHPFFDERACWEADLAATVILNRFTRAKQTMNGLAFDADPAEALAAFNEISQALHELHHLLMVGWWNDRWERNTGKSASIFISALSE